MGFSGPIEDQIAIRNLHDSYVDAVFRRDPNDWGANWAVDGRWHLMGSPVEGREAIVTLWNGAMAGFTFVAFFCQPASIDVVGDTATGRTYTHEVLEMPDGEIRRPVGLYEDRFAKVDGKWLYQERIYSMLKV